MNVLNNIVCDTSLLSQNFKESYPPNKIISTQNISSQQESLHMLNSVSQISLERPLSSITHSSPSDIRLFNSSGQIQIPNSVETGFEDRNDVSVFSDQFPEIVPSWLTHDFMKVSSENLSSPAILPNVSDIYPSPRETEHLVMLDLGFPAELNSQDVVPNGFNDPIDSQKLLVELPMQRFSNNESLLMSSFNDMNSMQYSKFKQNVQINDQSIMNSVLPCQNDLLNIPLHANLSEQCLTTSSPSIMPDSQSQSHPVDVVCGKLPQINLNHLDSFLGNESSLSEIQLLRQDFPEVCMPVEVNSNQQNQSCLNNCNPNQHNMSCPPTVFLNSSVPPFPQVKDASVQATEDLSRESLVSNMNCFSCSKVSINTPIEVTQCFKCKFCDFVSIHKCAVESHINSIHSNLVSSLSMINNRISESGQTLNVANSNSQNISTSNESHLVTSSSATVTNSLTNYSQNVNNPVKAISRNFIQKEEIQCLKCSRKFSETNAYKSHLISEHNLNLQLLHVNNIENNALSYPLMPHASTDESNLNSPSLKANPLSHQSISTKLRPIKSSMPKEPPKQTEETSKKTTQKKPSNTELSPNSGKAISSHKKAWRRKMRRELGTYICEFKNCNVRFRALDNLEYHKKCHADGGSTFVCPECSATFENWGNIATHLWRVHKNDMELHACDQCQYRNYSLSRLENVHKRIHKDEYLFLCDTCGKSFKNGKQLGTHRLRHEKEKKKAPEENKCKLCGMHFLSKSLLIQHEEAIHNKKRKRFMCSHCNFSTVKLSTLQQHTRQHTGEKPFACNQCDYRTADHNSLRRHEMRHSGEKKYKCQFCPYSSIQASAFKVHMKKHPEQIGILFSCELCSFQTLKQDKYKQHKQEHENTNMEQNFTSCINEMSATENTFPLAEAMDISLSYSDDFLLSQFSKKNTMQSFFTNSDSNVLVLQESAR